VKQTAQVINPTIQVQMHVPHQLTNAPILLLAETSLLQLEHVTSLPTSVLMKLIALLVLMLPPQETVPPDKYLEVNAEPLYLSFLHLDATGTYSALVDHALLLSP